MAQIKPFEFDPKSVNCLPEIWAEIREQVSVFSSQSVMILSDQLLFAFTTRAGCFDYWICAIVTCVVCVVGYNVPLAPSMLTKVRVNIIL